jgi:hypothetical protein
MKSSFPHAITHLERAHLFLLLVLLVFLILILLVLLIFVLPCILLRPNLDILSNTRCFSLSHSEEMVEAVEVVEVPASPYPVG